MPASATMLVDVLLFASAADAVGGPQLTLELEQGATAVDVLAAVRAAAGGVEGVPPGSRVAVNQAFAGPDAVIAPGDEVAVIPPVAGG